MATAANTSTRSGVTFKSTAPRGCSKVGRPQSNGFIERFHRTLLEEHLRINGRTTWYETVEEMQKDLDAYLETYNRHRPHGSGMEGRTPYDVLKAGIPRKRTRKPSAREKVKKERRI